MLDAALARAIDGLSILLAPSVIPAFTDGRTSYWSNYDALAEAGIQEIAVSADIHGFRIDDTPYLQIQAFFDLTIYDTDKFGPVYGDTTFEAAFSAHVARVLKAPGSLPQIHYTEAGMQGDDFVSLEVGRPWMEFLVGLSAHERLALSQSPEVELFFIPAAPPC